MGTYQTYTRFNKLFGNLQLPSGMAFSTTVAASNGDMELHLRGQSILLFYEGHGLIPEDSSGLVKLPLCKSISYVRRVARLKLRLTISTDAQRLIPQV